MSTKSYLEESDVGIVNRPKNVSRPVAIVVIVALIAGGVFLANTIANSPEAKKHHKQSAPAEQAK